MLIAPLMASMLIAVSATLVAAKPPELATLVGRMTPVGCAQYRFAFWRIYDAELWSDTVPPSESHYGLSLTYRTRFSRTQLVDSSIAEMARISGQPKANFARAREEMFAAFGDVEPGSRITAWRSDASGAQIFLNGQPTGRLTRQVDLFFDIWLGEDTRRRRERSRLLAGQCDD